MKLTACACVLAAVFAASSADLAEAAPQSSTLTIANGVVDVGSVRMIAGEVNGEGVLYAEYYDGAALRYAMPYWEVYIDGQASTVRELHGLVLQPTQTADGFAFSASDEGGALQCTALLWADATATCTRDGTWVPPGAPACAAALKSNTERFQCNGLRDIFTTPVIPHDELLRVCQASFRYESNIVDCMRNGYNAQPATFRDGLAACTDAYPHEDERRYCMFYSFAPADPADRPPAGVVRACGEKFDGDRATSDCVFETMTGAKQWHPRPVVSLAYDPTAPLALPAPAVARVTGGLLATAMGAGMDGTSVRVTGGMVESEAVLFVDVYDPAGAFKYSSMVDRVVVGGKARSLREVTALDRVALKGSKLGFHIVIAGKARTCSGDATATFARCR